MSPNTLPRSNTESRRPNQQSRIDRGIEQSELTEDPFEIQAIAYLVKPVFDDVPQLQELDVLGRAEIERAAHVLHARRCPTADGS